MDPSLEPTHELAGHRKSTREELLDQHARIDALLSRLEEQAAAEVQPELDETWTELERALLDHMDEEEMFLFPLLEASEPAERAALATDHAAFRKLLGEIGVAIELHAIGLESIQELAARLRAHADRENQTLYGLAESSGLPGPRALLRRIARRARVAVDKTIHEVEKVAERAGRSGEHADELVDEASEESFPASDPPSFAGHRASGRT